MSQLPPLGAVRAPPADPVTAPPLPLFLKLEGRDVLVVGGGAMAALRARQLSGAGARVTLVAPEVREDVAALAAAVRRRPFAPADLDGVWLAVAAATPAVNREVAAAAESRRVFVNAVDDPEAATAYTAGVIRRGDVTVAVSTGGRAPALAGLLREGIEALLPPELDRWSDVARAARPAWKREGVPLAERRTLLLRALNALREKEGAPSPPLPDPLPRSAPLRGGEGDFLPTSTPTSTATPTAPTQTSTSTSTSALEPRVLTHPSPLRPRQRGERSGEGGITRDATAPGFVSLVGAGPGDPALLTRAAADRLARADVVLHDALVDPEVLRLAPRAHRFHVGKRAGRPSVSQRAIERLLVRAARRGQRVVRLKCGDPFVLGRGGEEAQALAAAGVPFELVPGVSSALAAPALAGIPVTHRGLSAGVTVLSGHAEEAYGPILDGLAPGTVTVVVLMGLRARADVAARLRARGWDGATPAAVVLGASGPESFTWRGTLAALGAAPLPADRAHLPGTLVVGAVAALALASGALAGPSQPSQPSRPSARAAEGA